MLNIYSYSSSPPLKLEKVNSLSFPKTILFVDGLERDVEILRSKRPRTALNLLSLFLLFTYFLQKCLLILGQNSEALSRFLQDIRNHCSFCPAVLFLNHWLSICLCIPICKDVHEWVKIDHQSASNLMHLGADWFPAYHLAWLVGCNIGMIG